VSTTAVIVCGAAAAALLLADLALSVMLLSVTSLSRVALRRIDMESGGRLPFLEEIKTLASIHRAAIHAVRQLCLLGAVVSVAAAASGAGMSRPWSLAFGVGIVAGVLLVETYGARAVALRDPRWAVRTTAFLARPVHVLTYPLFAPVRAAFQSWSVAAQEADREEDESDEDVEAFIEVGEREGILEPGEGDMVRGIMDLGETCIREIMTPRTDIVALRADATVVEARRQALEAGHSRLPVYGDTIDNVVGILHVRDLLRAWSEEWDSAPVSGFMRPALFVPETRTVAELLRELRQRTHIALSPSRTFSRRSSVTSGTSTRRRRPRSSHSPTVRSSWPAWLTSRKWSACSISRSENVTTTRSAVS